MIKMYLASPLGFAESTRSFMLRLKRLLKDCGLDVTNPWRNPLGKELARAQAIEDPERRRQALVRLNREIAGWNERAIRDCQLMVAVLDGPDVDSGTASEIGFAYALGKPILGLRTDFRLSGDNEASIVNLQVQYWIESSGGSIALSLRQLEERVGTIRLIGP